MRIELGLSMMSLILEKITKYKDTYDHEPQYIIMTRITYDTLVALQPIELDCEAFTCWGVPIALCADKHPLYTGQVDIV